jgi:lysophospholipase L1-like esterase
VKSSKCRSQRGVLVSLVTGVVGCVLAALVAPTSASAATGVQYVALGDSYASGVGSGSYISASGSCLRSTLAYPQLWANTHAPTTFTSVACSGAKTTDVTSTQLAAVTTSTTLVSITVGGNDIGFSTVMEDCVLYGTSTCVSEVSAAETAARATLPAKLDAVYSRIASAAPSARVVVADYPRFYDTSVWLCLGLSATSRAKIDEGADVLDGVISDAAARHSFTFADVRSRFASRHEICDGSQSWLHSLDWTDIGQSYHPTAAGQSGGYLPTFSAAAG